MKVSVIISLLFTRIFVGPFIRFFNIVRSISDHERHIAIRRRVIKDPSGPACRRSCTYVLQHTRASSSSQKLVYEKSHTLITNTRRRQSRRR
jgi:hypothetical protein